jgi:hypothetical protein
MQHAAHEAFAHDGTHRSAHELEFEASEHERQAFDASLHNNERVGLTRFLQRRREPLGILFLVLEFEAVDRHHLRADLEAALGVEQLLDALARLHANMEIALRTDEEVLLEVGPVEHRLAGRALDPQALGHRRLLDAGRALDPRRQQLLKPTHCVPPERENGERRESGVRDAFRCNYAIGLPRDRMRL